jgi:transglutaminase-like putative cysteine protease
MTGNEAANGPQGRGGPVLAAVFHFLVALVLALPISMAIWSLLPEIKWPTVAGIAIGRLVLIMAVVACLLWLLRKWTLVAYAVLVLALAVVTVLDLSGAYGYRNLATDYGQMLSNLSQRTEALPAVGELKPFKGAEELRAAMDYKDPVVRSFAVRAATTWFNDAPVAESDRKLVQAFSVFKVINSAWVYVSDPADDEYFATAKESVPLLAGDCDDHAVLMASAIKAIGGRVRLVRTTGHIYPELYVGDAKMMQRAAWLIRNELFPEEAHHADLYYHTDADGGRWINLDYTRHYPGGPVMNEKIIGILHV